jgi:membrane protein implicated in regulation of membrane protease activity
MVTASLMNLEFLSGLLLLLTVLGTAGYIARELFYDRLRGQSPNGSSAPRPERRGRAAKPVNAHLVGTIGEVVGRSEDEDRPMRVRLGLELWPARTAAGDAPFVAGTRIEVTAVDGPVVVVRRCGPEL